MICIAPFCGSHCGQVAYIAQNIFFNWDKNQIGCCKDSLARPFAEHDSSELLELENNVVKWHL